MNNIGHWMVFAWLFLDFHLLAAPIFIQRTSLISHESVSDSSKVSARSDKINIAVISAPSVIGKYAQSAYDVALATILSKHTEYYRLKQINMPDESEKSLSEALSFIRHNGFNAVLAPLTISGTRRLAAMETTIDVFVPTVHKRDLSDAPENFTFGSIDYISQIEALVPYMGNSIAIFYDQSAVGEQLKKNTEALFLETNPEKKSVASFSVDAQGDNIISYLAKPSKFNKKSIIIHIPVVKSSILAAHMTFTGVKERNILSTQINVDPMLLSLTQYNDRKNMILANSIVDFSSSISESNALMNNDIAFDWINYAVSVGIDDLVAKITNSPREYPLRIINNQVIYPVELLKADRFGFESIAEK